MKQKIFKIMSITIISILVVLTLHEIYKYVRVKTAKVDMVLKENRELEFSSKMKVSDFLKNINIKCFRVL